MLNNIQILLLIVTISMLHYYFNFILFQYPVVLNENDVDTIYMGQYYNGLNSLNIVSCYTNTDVYSLDDEIESDPKILSVWK